MKLNHIKTMYLLPTCVGITFSSHASWQLIENFETITTAEIAHHNTHPEAEQWGDIYIFDDPEDAGNKVFHQDPANFGVSINTIYSMLPLPESGVADGATATLYFRYWQVDGDHDINTGLSDWTIYDENQDMRRFEFGSFESQVRWNFNITARDGASFRETSTAVPPETWIEVWMVIDNAADVTTIYIRPEGGNQMHVPIPDGTGGTKMSQNFRNGTNEALVTFFMGSYNGGLAAPFRGDIWYIDDIHIDYSGETLCSPFEVCESAEWAGYSVTDGWADTGDFAGWLYVEHDPWIYSYKLSRYIYLPEAHVTAEGGWSYVIK